MNEIPTTSSSASLTAVNLLARQHLPHARCVVLIEACEESGSYDLPHYIDHLRDRIGEPSLVICLDSGCGDYERLWSTTDRAIALIEAHTGEMLGRFKADVMDLWIYYISKDHPDLFDGKLLAIVSPDVDPVQI